MLPFVKLMNNANCSLTLATQNLSWVDNAITNKIMFDTIDISKNF